MINETRENSLLEFAIAVTSAVSFMLAKLMDAVKVFTFFHFIAY